MHRTRVSPEKWRTCNRSWADEPPPLRNPPRASWGDGGEDLDSARLRVALSPLPGYRSYHLKGIVVMDSDGEDDPNAIVAKDYQMTIIQTRDGRVLNGIIAREDASAVVLRTPNDNVIVPRDEIKRQKLSEISMMPEGLLPGLSMDDARDLVGYLASPSQVPLP